MVVPRVHPELLGRTPVDVHRQEERVRRSPFVEVLVAAEGDHEVAGEILETRRTQATDKVEVCESVRAGVRDSVNSRSRCPLDIVAVVELRLLERLDQHRSAYPPPPSQAERAVEMQLGVVWDVPGYETVIVPRIVEAHTPGPAFEQGTGPTKQRDPRDQTGVDHGVTPDKTALRTEVRVDTAERSSQTECAPRTAERG